MAHAAQRERKRSPHHCQCGTAFDVCYFDDRRDPGRDGDPVMVHVACPDCGGSKTVALPPGADRTVVVEPGPAADQDAVDEGGGG